MAGFLRGANRPPARKGEVTGGKSPFGKSPESRPMPSMKPDHAMSSDHMGGNETKIIHHPNGEHEVHHADGEVTKHPNMGHATAHLHARHMGGEVGNMHHDGGKTTTHHVGPDGEVSGPTEHESPQDAASQLGQSMSGMDENEVEGYNPESDESQMM